MTERVLIDGYTWTRSGRGPSTTYQLHEADLLSKGADDEPTDTPHLSPVRIALRADSSRCRWRVLCFYPAGRPWEGVRAIGHIQYYVPTHNVGPYTHHRRRPTREVLEAARTFYAEGLPSNDDK